MQTTFGQLSAISRLLMQSGQRDSNP